MEQNMETTVKGLRNDEAEHGDSFTDCFYKYTKIYYYYYYDYYVYIHSQGYHGELFHHSLLTTSKTLGCRDLAQERVFCRIRLTVAV